MPRREIETPRQSDELGSYLDLSKPVDVPPCVAGPPRPCGTSICWLDREKSEVMMLIIRTRSLPLSYHAADFMDGVMGVSAMDCWLTGPEMFLPMAAEVCECVAAKPLPF